MDYIIVEKYRQLFSEHIEQALDYIKNLKEEDFKAKVSSMKLVFLNKNIFFLVNKFNI